MNKRIMAKITIVLLICVGMISCNKKDSAKDVSKSVPSQISSDAKNINTGFENNFISSQDFFIPDYTPCEPEKQIEAHRVNLKNISSSEKVTSIIPGLRKLNMYKTNYKTGKKSEKSDRAENTQIKLSKKQAAAPFTVCDWGPKGSIPSEVRNPSFYVLFSEPVVALEALNQPEKTSKYVSITPQIEGVFRWKGTSLLCFDAAQPCEPQGFYTITVNKQIKSLYDKPIEGDTTFTTAAAALKIVWFAAGLKYAEKNHVRFDNNDVPLEAAKDVLVQFNYDIDAQEAAKLSTITAKDKKLNFVTTQEKADVIAYHITDELSPQTKIKIAVGNGDKKTEVSYSTLQNFKYTYVYEGESSDKERFPVHICFSHPVDSKSLENAFSYTLANGQKNNVGLENIKLSENEVIIFGLPVNYKDKYFINVSPQLCDIYGQRLGKEAVAEVTVPEARSEFKFGMYGAKMLEKRPDCPAKVVFEYQNILADSGYSIRKTDNPLLGEIKDLDVKTLSGYKELSILPRNERKLEIVDLAPYLTNGMGAVRIDTSVRTASTWRKEGFFTHEDYSTIQVTDLGITVRYGINKAIVLVTQLSTGKPVENANVYIYNVKENSMADCADGKYLECAKTSADGFAVIPITAENASKLFVGYEDNFAIAAEKDGDFATFKPESHYPWRVGIYNSDSVGFALQSKPRIFMFTDRGIYKPGETLSFRGIDRDQKLGNFTPYSGEYSIVLKNNDWRNPITYESKTDKTSESGGFYGSFVIPEDAKPGTYSLLYKRSDNKTEESLYFTVSYFERAKFQSVVTLPKKAIIAGEKIEAQLSASYLAGGVPANAKFQSSWYREPCNFTSKKVQFKDYSFGMESFAEGSSEVAADEGTLDNEGKVRFSCATTGNKTKGISYNYNTSTMVTDVSNQKISSWSSIMVHPASYYVGISKPLGISGFPKSGQKLSFEYLLVSPEEDLIERDKIGQHIGKNKSMTATLFKEEWNIVQQQGIGGHVYSRYEKNLVQQNEQKISVNSKGKISVTPKEAGYYILRVTAKDFAGRETVSEKGFFVTGTERVFWNQDNTTSLRLTADKDVYNPGETAQVLLESTLPAGHYLITVEREGIFTEEVRYFDRSMQVLEIPIARNYVPVVYVSVASYSVRNGAPSTEYGKIDLDKPKSFYGATRLFVNPRVKAFSVKVDSIKPIYRPGEEAEITLTATKNGKPLANAELSLVAADRGVLDLINYHVPNPLDFFYANHNFPLLVKGGDSRSLLLDPVTYEAKTLRGGDANYGKMESAADGDGIEERRNFNPTAVFLPVLKTDENGKVTCRFKLPDTLTTYRVTALGAAGEFLAFQESEIAVQNPVNIQEVLPRRMRERDTSELGVLISNLDSVSHDITVALEMRGAESHKNEAGETLRAGEAFVDADIKEHKVTVPSGANTVVYFDVAAVRAGVVDAVFTIHSDIINERIVCPVIIEKPYIRETVTSVGILNDEEKSITEAVVIPSFADDGDSRLSVAFGTTGMGLLKDVLQYISDYPFDCLEQQSVKIMPLILFDDKVNDFDSDKKIDNVSKTVKAFFKKLAKLQHSDGGFGYWEESRDSHVFVSMRIGTLWAMASEAGYSESDLAINKKMLAEYLQNKSAEMKDVCDEEKLEICHVISCLGVNADEDFLNKLYSKEDISVTALSLIGLTTSDAQLAAKCAERIKTYIRPTARGVDISVFENDVVSPYERIIAGFDKLCRLSRTLELFVKVNSADEMIGKMLFTLLENQKCGYWKDLSTTSIVLNAVAKVIKIYNLENKKLSAEVLLDSKKIAAGKFDADNADIVNVVMDKEKLKSYAKDKQLPLEIIKNGKGSLLYSASLTYALPEEMQSSRDEGIGINVNVYDDATGAEITDNEFVTELETDKVYRMEVNVMSTFDRNYLALRLPIPSGVEIVDVDTTSGNNEEFRFVTRKELYDNEAHIFWDDFVKGRSVVSLRFRTVRRGVFPTPPVSAECMYESEVFGRTNGGIFTIK